MGTAPKKPSSSATGTGKGKGGTAAPQVPLTEMLARDGAPWRPFEDKGILVKPLKAPRSAAAIFAACEKLLLSHLKAVCLWPEKDRNQSWRVGDYSYYILEFTPKPNTIVYVEFWSEPDDDNGVLFEVSSRAMNPPADKFVDTEKQELLRDHGFEIGGKRNFRKAIKIKNAREAGATAREAIALLTRVLGYDGTQELRYELSLRTQMTVRHVLSQVSPDTLEKLLREWGFPADLKPREDGRPPLIDCRAEAGPFGVLLLDEEREGPDSYQALVLRAFHSLPPGDDDAVIAVRLGIANQVNRKFTALLQASVDTDGDLLLEATVLLHGGVTAEHLRTRFELWRRMIGEIAQEIK